MKVPQAGWHHAAAEGALLILPRRTEPVFPKLEESLQYIMYNSQAYFALIGRAVKETSGNSSCEKVY